MYTTTRCIIYYQQIHGLQLFIVQRTTQFQQICLQTRTVQTPPATHLTKLNIYDLFGMLFLSVIRLRNKNLTKNIRECGNIL